jgi:seryl-tRNA synthetase family protein
MKDTKEFTYDVVEHLGNFVKHDNYSKEINKVAWNGRPPIYDIRGWHIGKDGIKPPLKGISMSKEDLIALRNLLQSIDIESMEV